MTDIHVRIEGRAGRITLDRPRALNALTYAMCLAIRSALREWRDEARVAVIVIDAVGERAFCAGGDLGEMHATGAAGDFDYGRRFWRDEYAMNAELAGFPKPVVSFMQGFTMGGGVGVGCHAAHRVVGPGSVVAMPECGVGLVPDVGGSLILARAPGRLGAWLGTTAARLTGAEVIHAGFADHLIDEARWPGLIAALAESGDTALLQHSPPPLTAQRRADLARIDRLFAADDLPGLLAGLRNAAPDDQPMARAALAALSRVSPLSAACTLEMLRRLRETGAGLREALALEYRFTSRAMQHGDFIEGIRAMIIDKDRKPRWRHDLDGVTRPEIEAMLAPLGKDELQLEDAQ